MSVTNRVNVMISTDPAGQGGVASVVKAMLADSFSADWQIRHIVSHRAGSKVSMIWIFLLALSKLTLLRLLHRPGIAHIHLASRGSFSRKNLLAKWARKLGFRVILHLHGAQFDQFYHHECNTAKQQKVADLFGLASKVVVLGDKWQHWIKVTFPKVRDVRIIYNPGPRNVHSRSASLSPTVIFLGRLGERKGVADLLKALPAVVARFPNMKLILGGDGDLQRYRQQATSLGLSEHVKFAGWIGVEEKFSLMSSAWLFVLPSYSEGFPVGIVEAMACGVPIVASDVGGIPDAITNEQEGILIEAGNITALADALIRMLADSELAERFASNAQRKYEQNFSSQAIMPLWQQLYTEILND